MVLVLPFFDQEKEMKALITFIVVTTSMIASYFFIQQLVQEGGNGFRMSDEVRQAVISGRGVVALESTIIAHGMPYPQNLKVALEVEEIVRQAGAVPATIGLIDGELIIGLSEEQLERLARAGGGEEGVIKTSRRDLAYVMSQRRTGATTVAGTMIAANMAGVQVFVTGGLGGVHRHGEESMDVSADLMELARTPVAVVCAGVKSILDIGRTLEVLETQGVPVIGYQTNEFPAFFTRHSGHPVSSRLDNTIDIAALLHASRHALKLQSGVVVAVPIPQEHEAEATLIQSAIDTALADAHRQSIVGKEITPFLLSRVNQLTDGKSLHANIALVKNNARLGALLAVDLAAIQSSHRTLFHRLFSSLFLSLAQLLSPLVQQH